MRRIPGHVFRAWRFTRNVMRPIDHWRPAQLVCTMGSNPEAKSKSNPATMEPRKVVFDGQEYTEITEGLACILKPVSAPQDDHKGGAPKDQKKQKEAHSEEEQQQVFYNPIQQYNRDLTVLVIKAYGEEVIAARREAEENRLNSKRKKRKRQDAEGDRPQKQRTSSCGEEHEARASVPDEGVDTAVVDIVEEPSKETANGNQPPVDRNSKEGAEMSMETSNQVKGQEVTAMPASGATTKTATGTATGTATESTTAVRPKVRNLDEPRFTILDALSASGLRALRYVQELPFVTSVTANDLGSSAVEAIKRNAIHNGVESKINVVQGDARAHMYSLLSSGPQDENNRKQVRRHGNLKNNKYDVIDLDPYGTAATFFDSVLHAVRDDGGLLCITCTDSGVWATHGYAEKTFALYNGIPVKGYYSHEAGLRLVLHALATTAARNGLAIEPLLSLSIDYYMRIFVRVKKSPASVKFLPGKTMMVNACDQGCNAWQTQLLMRNKKVPNQKGTGVFYKHGLAAATTDQICKHCSFRTHLAGPMYAGPIHSADFIRRILRDLPNASEDIYGTLPRIQGMLQTALEEFSLPLPQKDGQPESDQDDLATLDPYPFFFHPAGLAGVIHCTCPDEQSFRGALRGLGYEATRSHCRPGSIKTNAPWSIVWHIMREWVRQKSPVNESKIKPNTAAYKLLRLDRNPDTKEIDSMDEELKAVDKLEVVFNKALGQEGARKRLVRYQMNPTQNWGPLSKAKGD